jgi:two-component system, NarL family, response regulator NreC
MWPITGKGIAFVIIASAVYPVLTPLVRIPLVRQITTRISVSCGHKNQNSPDIHVCLKPIHFLTQERSVDHSTGTKGSLCRSPSCLAHRYPLIREGLKAVFERYTDIDVLGETDSGPEAVTLVARLHPDVLIIDVMLHGLSGLEVTRQVRQRRPRTRVIVLSTSVNVTHVRAAMRYGAAGYLLQEVSGNELVQAVREVVAGRPYLSPVLAAPLNTPGQRASTEVLDPYETLTTREREVLHLAAEGRTYPEIAAVLGISHSTVETHRAHLMKKLGLHAKTDLIRYALHRGILPMETYGVPDSDPGIS